MSRPPQVFGSLLALFLVGGCVQPRGSGGGITAAARGNAAVESLGDGGPATEASLNVPHDVALGDDGSLYIADRQNHRIRKVDPAGIIATVAGDGWTDQESGLGRFAGDGRPAIEASLSYPYGVALGDDGSLYIVDRMNHRIRKVDAAGIITTIAGNGEQGYSGDGGPATEASLNYPTDVAAGADGSVYIADTYNQRVRKVDAAGVITTVAGKGWPPAYSGDGGPATEAGLFYPAGVAVGADGSLYVTGRGSHRIRKVDPAGVITTAAGTGEAGYSGDSGPAVEAAISWVFGVAVGEDASLYIADGGNHRIRKVDREGIITTVAGSGERGFRGDGGPATEASLSAPVGVAVGPDGSVYIADSRNHRVRKVDPAGIITTAAGGGPAGKLEEKGDRAAATPARRLAHIDRQHRWLRPLDVIGVAILAPAACLAQAPSPRRGTWPAERFVSRDAEIFGRLVAASLFLAVIVGGFVVLVKGWQYLALRDADLPGYFLLKLAWRAILVCVGTVLVASGFEAVMMALGRT